jgi:acyl-[acyl-carrier-protein] desaturase
MPGANMPGFGRKAVQIALAGIYDLQQHLDEVVSPVLRSWNVFERNDLSGDGLVARDEIAAFMNKSGKEAATFNDKREVYFDRLIARGQQPIRIQK